MEAISRLARALVLLRSPKQSCWVVASGKREKPGMRFPVFSTMAALPYGMTPKICFSKLKQGRDGIFHSKTLVNKMNTGFAALSLEG